VFKVVIDECERGFRDVEFEGDEFEAKDELEEEFEAEFGEEPAKKSLKDNEKNEMKEEQEWTRKNKKEQERTRRTRRTGRRRKKKTTEEEEAEEEAEEPEPEEPEDAPIEIPVVGEQAEAPVAAARLTCAAQPPHLGYLGRGGGAAHEDAVGARAVQSVPRRGPAV
jgi:hypothetical protein